MHNNNSSGEKPSLEAILANNPELKEASIGNFKVKDIINSLEEIKNLYLAVNDNLQTLVSPSLGQSLQKFVNLVIFPPKSKWYLERLNNLAVPQSNARENLSRRIKSPQIIIIEDGQSLSDKQKIQAQEAGVIFLRKKRKKN